MIDDKRRDAIFDEMNGYVLKLDPTASGPRYFIDKIAICRNYLNSVSLVLSELQREKLVIGSELHKVTTIIELDSARLLSTDDNVRRLASIKDRESMVAHLLRDKRERVDQLKDQLRSVEGIMKHVSLRNRELHATMDAIKNQRRFMQIEVQTGSFYGDERVPDVERSVSMDAGGTHGDFTEDQIREIIGKSNTITDFDEVTAALDVAAAQATSTITIELDVKEPKGQTQMTVSQEEDEESIRLFLGDSSAGSSTVEPSVSGLQEKIEDYSSLLDAV